MIYTADTIFINGMPMTLKEHVLLMLDKEEVSAPYAALSCELADNCHDYDNN
jgi:hypothetical protein